MITYFVYFYYHYFPQCPLRKSNLQNQQIGWLRDFCFVFAAAAVLISFICWDNGGQLLAKKKHAGMKNNLNEKGGRRLWVGDCGRVAVAHISINNGRFWWRLAEVRKKQSVSENWTRTNTECTHIHTHTEALIKSL